MSDQLESLLRTPGVSLEHLPNGLLRVGPHGEESYTDRLEHTSLTGSKGENGFTGPRGLQPIDPSENCETCIKYRKHYQHNECECCQEYHQHLVNDTVYSHACKFMIRSQSSLTEIRNCLSALYPELNNYLRVSSTSKRLELKSEHVEDLERLNLEHQQKVRAYEDSISDLQSRVEESAQELIEMGGHIEYWFPELPQFSPPKEWYNWDHQESICIYCHVDHPLAEFLRTRFELNC
jgi:hypothetical protein